jgi:WD40 repeat protein
MEHQTEPRHVACRDWKCRFLCVSCYSCYGFCYYARIYEPGDTDTLRKYSNLWDTYSGDVLHSFSHNHIVRTVALSPNGNNLMTGGQEKKVRVFDLARPEAEPDLLFEDGATLSHEGTVKSVVYAGEHIGVSAGEDGLLKCVKFGLCLHHEEQDMLTTICDSGGGTCGLGRSCQV